MHLPGDPQREESIEYPELEAGLCYIEIGMNSDERCGSIVSAVSTVRQKSPTDDAIW